LRSTTTSNKKDAVEEEINEELYIDTAEAEHMEMYLKAIWTISERQEEIKVSSIAKLLNISQPSVVQMLHKLHESHLEPIRKHLLFCK
jgi:DtxR family transcriptional regulator, Mn-dependent transcriptional regulator